MPSSLIIVALAAAWLIVLVPMVARRRQEIVRTADSALAARVVRRGTSARVKQREEFAMSAENSKDEAHIEDSAPADVDLPEPDSQPVEAVESEERPSRRRSGESDRHFRPGRGGYDPELAEIAARAKYAFRQRVVITLAVIAVITAVAAVAVFPPLWWAHALVDVSLIGYLAYLRRQVRIENDIRQRRLARYQGASRPSSERRFRESAEDADSFPRDNEGLEGKTAPVPPRARSASAIERETSAKAVRATKNAVVLDLEDEAPDFYELNAAGSSFRRASGE